MTDYGKVVLTLSNVLLPPEKLYPNPTPSTSEGLPYDIEYDLRLIGCELIQTAGLLLRLPQTAIATGQVLLHRYFYFSSLVRRPMEIVAMACITLAAKIEENARRVRDVINVFHHIKQVRSGSIIQPLSLDQVYIDRKNAVISVERRLLKELGFCVYVKHPHKMIAMYLKALEQEREKDLVQTAWNYMNDSLRTDVFVRFPSETIACACIDLAARKLQIPLPRNPQWYLTFGAQPEEIHYIMIAILRLYKHRPKPLEELEKVVNTLREKREGEKRKLRPELGNDSPAPQQIVPTSNPSAAAAFSTPTIVQSEVISSVITTTTIAIEETNNVPAILNGKSTKKENRESSHESLTANTHHHQRHHRRKPSNPRSRSASRSPLPSPVRHSQKKKKTSHRSRSRSRSSSRKRHHHQKDRHHHSNHRRKDRKHRSRSSSRDDNHYSSKDANNNLPPRSSKPINGVSSSSHRKFNLK